jgi:ABC-type branched-subunit amino acid transport system permease subunit
MALTERELSPLATMREQGWRKAAWLFWPGNSVGAGLLPGMVIYLAAGFLLASSAGGYLLTVVSLGLVNVVIAVGFSIAYSQCGVFSFATFGFAAVGGFSYAWFANHMPAWLAMLAAVAVTAVVGFLVRAGTVRLNRLYFAIASLAIGSLMVIVLENWPAVSGGTSGIGPVAALTFGLVDGNSASGIFLIGWIVSAIAIFIGGLLYRSAWSRDLLVVRDLRRIGQNDGVPVRRLELEAYTIHAAFIGLAGVLLADTNKFISTSSFDVTIALQALIMVVLGGAGKLSGPIIGAVVVTALPEVLRGASTWSGVVYGLILLVVLVALPEGVVGLWDRAKVRIPLQLRRVGLIR